MRPPLAIRAVASVMEAVLPRDVGEAALGDLNEEYLLRAQSTSSPRAAAWMTWQVASSMPRLFWMSAKRLSWLVTLGVAAGTFYVLGLIEPYMHRAIYGVIAPAFFWQLIVDLCVGFTACACGGFLATCLRRGSAAIYALIGTGYIVSGLPNVNPELPVWFVAAFLVVAFVAPLLGGAVFVAVSHRLPGRGNYRGGQSR